MTATVRLLRQGALPGRWNMAVDEALATSGDAAHVAPVATLRFYGWRPAALSLGHHQPADLVDVDALRRRSLDLVRRPTGGMAVLHDEELTLALAGPDLRAWGLDLGDTVALLASSLAGALAGRGLGALAEPGRPAASRADGVTGTACFSGGGRHEVWIAGRKIAGLAARRWGRSFLVHGSFLLGRSHLALPSLLKIPDHEKAALARTLEARTVSLGELEAGGESRGGEIAEAVAGAVGRARSLPVVAAELRAGEEEAARAIAGRTPDLVGG